MPMATYDPVPLYLSRIRKLKREADMYLRLANERLLEAESLGVEFEAITTRRVHQLEARGEKVQAWK